MIKPEIYLLKLFLLYSITSFGQVDSHIDFQNKERISYWSPLFVYKSKSWNSMTLKGYEKTTRATLDSLFIIDADQYRISEKLEWPKNHEEIKEEIITIFSSLDNGTNNLRLSNNLSALFEDAPDRYLMLIAFYPSIGKLARAIPYIENSILRVCILDSKTNKITFYNYSSSGTTLNNGYRRNLLKDLENIYANMNWN